MTMALRSFGASLFCAVLLLPPLTNAANTPTKCYVLSGLHNADAGFRCDNSTTGHSSCCQPGAICYSNGVCQQANSGIQDYVRVGCTDPTWQDPVCLDQCTSYARNSIAGIRFCGSAITSTNRYCCDNGTTGIGSFACCQNPNAIFDINPIATFVAQIPLSFTSTSTTASTTASSISSSTSAASTTASSPTPTHDPPYRRPGSHALAIGLGVGIPLLVILVAAIAFFLWRYFHDDEENLPSQPEISEPGVMYLPVDPMPREVPGSMPNPNKAYYGGREYDPGPHELPVQGIVHELHTPIQERR